MQSVDRTKIENIKAKINKEKEYNFKNKGDLTQLLQQHKLRQQWQFVLRDSKRLREIYLENF